MELQTVEEVHVICLFDTIEQVTQLQQVVDHHLPDIPNNIEYFGEQFVVDHTGEFIQRKEQLLIASTNLSFEQAEQSVHNLGGLFIPAHVNRQAFGLIYHLGFVPPDAKVDALELSRHISPAEALKKFPQIGGFSLIQNGDVHYLDGFLGINQFMIGEPTISEIKLALNGENGRTIDIIYRSWRFSTLNMTFVYWPICQGVLDSFVVNFTIEMSPRQMVVCFLLEIKF